MAWKPSFAEPFLQKRKEWSRDRSEALKPTTFLRYSVLCSDRHGALVERERESGGSSGPDQSSQSELSLEHPLCAKLRDRTLSVRHHPPQVPWAAAFTLIYFLRCTQASPIVPKKILKETSSYAWTYLASCSGLNDQRATYLSPRPLRELDLVQRNWRRSLDQNQAHRA